MRLSTRRSSSIRGDRWQYGINLDWAGKMVEAVSGQTLGQYLTDHIFEPLGMPDTAFKITPSMNARLAKIHARTADDSLEPMDLVLEQNPEFEMGGGGLYSTVGDYLKFIRMILNNGSAHGTRVLRPETVADMSVNQMGDCRVRKLTTVMPELSADAEFFPRDGQDLWAELHDQHGTGADGSCGGQSRVGRSG